MKGVPPPDEIPLKIRALMPERDDKLIAGFFKQTLKAPQLLEKTTKKVKGNFLTIPKDIWTNVYPKCIRGHALANYYQGSALLRYEGPVNPDGSTCISFRNHAVAFKGDWTNPNMNNACSLYAFQVVEYTNNSPYHLSGALNIMNDHVAYRDADKEMINAQAAVGGLAHASFDFTAQTSACKKNQVGLKIQYVKRTHEIRYHYNNPAFMASTYRVVGDPLWCPLDKREEDCCRMELEHRRNVPQPSDDQNSLWNGIIYIPGEECKRMGLQLYNAQLAWEMHKQYMKEQRKQVDAEESLPKFGEEEPMDTKEDEEDSDNEYQGTTSNFLGTLDDLQVRCWFALPPNHVLSWPCNTSENHREQMKLKVFNWNVYTKDQTHLFCYLVPDTVLRGMMTEYNIRWANRVDVRPFGDLGIRVAPVNSLSQPTPIDRVQLEIQVHFSVVAWDNPPTDRPLIAPILHHDMPTIMEFRQTPF